MEEVVEVTERDEFVRWVSREEVHRNKLIHRSVNAVVLHPDGRMLIQLRHRDKKTYPHCWDISCSGHVDRVDHPNDDGSLAKAACDKAIQRELLEELATVSPELVRLARGRLEIVSMILFRTLVATWMVQYLVSDFFIFLWIDGSPQWRGTELLAGSIDVFILVVWQYRRSLSIISIGREHMGAEGK